MRRRTSAALSVLAAVSLIAMGGLSFSEGASAEEPIDVAPLDTLAQRIAAAADSGASPDQIGEAVSLPVDGGGSLSFDEANRVSATVFFDEQPDEEILDRVREDAVIDQVYEMFPAAQVRVDPVLIANLSEVPGISSVTPTLAPFVGHELSTQTAAELKQAAVVSDTLLAAAPNVSRDSCGPIPVEADTPLRADEARATYSVDGSGVTIGIISDSFAQTTEPTSAEDDVQSGALPGAENPCGRDQTVKLISDQVVNGSDEGRAMAQLVHGIAPGAKILFADRGLSELGMAENIQRLADAGADIIVDDVSWSSEPYYQQGYVSSAIEYVKKQFGVVYFTSVGNSTTSAITGPSSGLPHSSWQTNAYRPMACPAWVTVKVLNGSSIEQIPAAEAGMDCMDFEPGNGGSIAFDTLTTRQSQLATEFPAQLYGAVGEPMYGVSTRFQVQFYREVDSSQDPEFVTEVGMVGGPFTTLSGELDLPLSSKVRMVVVRAAHNPSTAPPALFLEFTRGGDGIAERHFMGDGVHDWVGESPYGHAADGSAISVGSMAWDKPTQLREYSSLGPGTLLYETVHGSIPAARLATPQIISVPHLVSVDGTRTTFFGVPDEEDGESVYRFEGTSAASPNAAAVAALGLSYRPELSGARLSELVVDTARDSVDGIALNNPYTPRFTNEHAFGAGLIDAMALLNAADVELPAPVPAAPSGLKVAEQTSASLTFSWDPAIAASVASSAELNVDPSSASVPVERYVIVLMQGASEIEASQLRGNPLPTTYRFNGLQPNTSYSFKLTAYGKGDRVGASQTIEAKTLSKSEGAPGDQTGTNQTRTENLSATGSSGPLPLLGLAGTALTVGAVTTFLVARRAKRGATS